MNKIQKVDFKSIDDFMEFLPAEELSIVESLKSIITDTIPEVKEKLAYNVPFYYRHYRLCYIWPASIPWGGLKSGVSLGFCYGALIEDGGYLNKSAKKQTASKNFSRLSDIDGFMLRDLLYQAVAVDSDLYNKKKDK